MNALNVGYGVCSLLIAAGSIGGGWLLLRAWRRVGLPLLAGGVFFLVVAIPLTAAGTDNERVLALTVWSLFYVWLGLGLRTTAIPTANFAADRRTTV